MEMCRAMLSLQPLQQHWWDLSPEPTCYKGMCHGIAEVTCSLVCAGGSEAGFHCILLDPPWENASARRGAKYPMLPSRNLKAIPMQRLMHQVGPLPR